MPEPEAGRSYSYADYLTWPRWPEGPRWELFEGEAVAMNAPLREHQRIAGELFGRIWDFLKGHPCEVYMAPFDVRLPRQGKETNRIQTVVQPDISVICDPEKLDDLGCLGPPDWILEVVSPGSVRTDYVKKLTLYELHGIPEYWIVNPQDRLVMVFRLNQQGAYGKPDTYTQEDTLTPARFPELSIRLEDIFAGS
ncbi:MAG: Uma2 family endonuclease [Candidatus Sericytochromatia bacterium]